MGIVISFVPHHILNNRIWIDFKVRKIVFYSRVDPKLDFKGRKHIHIVFDGFKRINEFVCSQEQIEIRENFCGVHEEVNNSTDFRFFRIFIYPDSYFEIEARAIHILNENENWLGYKLKSNG